VCFFSYTCQYILTTKRCGPIIPRLHRIIQTHCHTPIFSSSPWFLLQDHSESLPQLIFSSSPWFLLEHPSIKGVISYLFFHKYAKHKKMSSPSRSKDWTTIRIPGTATHCLTTRAARLSLGPHCTMSASPQTVQVNQCRWNIHMNPRENPHELSCIYCYFTSTASVVQTDWLLASRNAEPNILPQLAKCIY